MKSKQKSQLLSTKSSGEPARVALLKSLLGGENAAAAGLYADWGACDWDVVGWFVQVMALNNAAVLLGASRDRTQYHIKVYIGNEAPNKWFAGDDQGRELMAAWMRATCEAMTE